MKKLKKVFGQHAFTVCVLLLCCVLFSWSFLISDMTAKNIFYFLFVAWFCVIGVLFLIASSYRSSDHQDTPRKEDPGDV